MILLSIQSLGIQAGVLVIGLVFFCFFGLIWAWWLRQKYLKEAQGKIKGIFFAPGISQPIEVICEVESSGVEVKAPVGLKNQHIGTYYINRDSKWDTPYPTKPPLGLWFIQVPIATHWWELDNPEPPIHASSHNMIATASRIFASGDNAFMFMFRTAKMELDKQRQELMNLMKNKLNANVIYIGGFLMIALIIGMGFLMFKMNSQLTDIAKAIGVVVK